MSGDDVVEFRLALTDTSDQPLPTDASGNPQVAVGQTFRLYGYSRDVRHLADSPSTPKGVFAAYMDVFFTNSDLLTIRYGETQRLRFFPEVGSPAITGTFKLAFDGQETANITYDGGVDYLAEKIQLALEALPNIGPGNVLVAVEPPNPKDPVNADTIRVQFLKALGEQNLPEMTIDPAGLTNCDAAVVTQLYPGDDPTNAGTFRTAFTAVSPFINGLRAVDKTELESGQDPSGRSFGGVGSFLEGFNSPGVTAEWPFFSVDLKAIAPGVVEFSGNPSNSDVAPYLETDTLVFPYPATDTKLVVEPQQQAFVQDINNPLVLEISPGEVYVDAAWTGTVPGTDPDGAGPATSFGYDAFATFPEGLDAVALPGIVHVAKRGTSGDDVWSFESLANADPDYHTLRFDGTSYAVPASVKIELNMDALEGSDAAALIDQTGALTATLRSTGGTIAGLGYDLNLVGFETYNFSASNGGRANLYDTAGDDEFVAFPTSAYLRGGGFSANTWGFGEVHGYATSGGLDYGYLLDSAGNDTAELGAQNSRMAGTGFDNNASGFDVMVARSTAGGADTAYLYDSPGNDIAELLPSTSRMFSNGFENNAQEFEVVNAESTVGGVDYAYLYDSAGNDTAEVPAGSGRLYGSNFDNNAHSFDAVIVWARNGGADTAYMYDSTGDDVAEFASTYGRILNRSFDSSAREFESVTIRSTAGGLDYAYLYDSDGDNVAELAPTWTTMVGTGFSNRAENFEVVITRAPGAGADMAYMYDSAGDDVFEREPGGRRMRGAGYDNNAQGFDAVEAQSTAGVDYAYFYDTAGDDTAELRPESGRLYGAGYDDIAKGFDVVVVKASGGTDTAYLYDSAGNEVVEMTPQSSRMVGSGFDNAVFGFDIVEAVAANGGNDSAYLYDSAGDDVFTFAAGNARLQGAGYNNWARSFDYVSVSATGGGSDLADLSDTPGNDVLVGRTNWFQLLVPGAEVRGTAFERVRATSSLGGTDTVDVSSVDYIFERIGNWIG